jgi:hypothetical protein
MSERKDDYVTNSLQIMLEYSGDFRGFIFYKETIS